ncbi:MAG: 4-(cytidine 5'-diphospho)-2-C-methyl-D-erythritol kinase [Eubacteriales bacterium]|nr:4-(cytidine 5'-diphospho)-2-C-methyl-D-erythritol kinase [Eubacteriales bacterium]
MIMKCNAKINLTLDMVGLRQDGYHLLRSVMHPIPLCDELTIEKADEISLKCNIKRIPVDGRNLVCKAAQLFFDKTGIKGGMKAYLNKKTPSGAGLGGGSADAASTLRALNEIYEYGAENDLLKAWAVKLGADVPFFIDNEPALAEGIGEILSPCKALPSCKLLLIKPNFSINTKRAYEILGDYKEPQRSDLLLSALEKGSWEEIAEAVGNGIQKCIAKEYPEIDNICDTMKNHGAYTSCMTGSGSAVFGLFPTDSDLMALKDKYNNYFVFEGNI